MKKIILVLALLTLATNFAYSEEHEPEKMDADKEYVMSILRLCKSYAQEDEISKPDMKAYLLTCINNELEYSYYKQITVLPKEEGEAG